MSQKTVPARDNSKLIFQALEPRIMFDGAAVFTATEVLDQLEDLYTEYGEDRYRPSPILKRMVKNNQTFY